VDYPRTYHWVMGVLLLVFFLLAQVVFNTGVIG
jgi:hypothetical protein